MQRNCMSSSSLQITFWWYNCSHKIGLYVGVWRHYELVNGCFNGCYLLQVIYSVKHAKLKIAATKSLAVLVFNYQDPVNCLECLLVKHGVFLLTRFRCCVMRPHEEYQIRPVAVPCHRQHYLYQPFGQPNTTAAAATPTSGAVMSRCPAVSTSVHFNY